MGSFKGNGRGKGSKPRNDRARLRRQGHPDLESLETRRLLTGGGSTWTPTDPNNLLDAQNGPMANLGPDVVKVYGEYLTYEAAGAKGAFTSPLSSQIHIKGTTIGLDVKGSGNFGTFESALQTIGMTVTSTNTTYEIIEGYVPIADLPKVAEQAQTVDANPLYIYVLAQEGISPNQADLAENVAPARTNLGLSGAGQKVGVLSDSVNDFQGGLATSVSTGDLPNNVQVIQDYPANGNPAAQTDEGRAMLEQIYDLAPAAKLAFATGEVGDLGFAQNILALYNAGSQTIVDDLLGDGLDPYYQDGIVQQAINTVVAEGGSYVSAAGNEADSGYESTFRGVSATIPAIGAGTYQNFDPTGASQTTELGINVYNPSTIDFQYDQPFYTTNGVVSNVEIDILDANGNLVSQANANNIAMQTPFQQTATLQPGQYFVAIKVDSGPNPGHIFFTENGDGGFSVDTKFGGAGPTYYASTGGHNAGADTIGVGAVPFWATPSYTHTPSADVNEPFSSFGPRILEFAPNGTPLPAQQVIDQPEVSGTDANNTSFFIPGENLDTTQVNFPANPPYPGDAVTSFANPTTATNQSVATLENFTGTSSASPNVAAIIALMKQESPNITNAEIVNDLETTALSLDGKPAGIWSPQAGFGLVNAVAAIQAAETLRVSSITPGNGQALTTIPSVINVFFSQPVNLSTVSASNLTVTGPNGAIVIVGAPSGVDSATFPTEVAFPITIVPAPGQKANGLYRFVHPRLDRGPARRHPLTGVFNDQVQPRADPSGRRSSAPRSPAGSRPSRSASPSTRPRSTRATWSCSATTGSTRPTSTPTPSSSACCRGRSSATTHRPSRPRSTSPPCPSRNCRPTTTG